MIHQHNCYACGIPLACCCPDKRNKDRETGKDRKFWCVDCGEMWRLLREFFKNDPATMKEVA